ncbi:MAG: amidohydrolase family protein [Planctomycetes bacterium]|nr:amidohydrolase family protein [Planctomycetota bacterium]
MIWQPHRRPVVHAALAFTLLVPALASAQEPAAIITGRYVAPDGTLQPGAAILLSGGKIQSIVPADSYDKETNVVRHPNAVLCPGLIDVRSQIGASENLIETTNAIDPGASAIDSLDRHHRDFRAALRAGITTVMLTPSPNNLISGAAAIVKTARASKGEDDAILVKHGPLMFALGSSVWSYDRAPTSRVGSLAMLRAALDDAAGGRGHERLQAFAKGRIEGVVVCEEAMDVSAALRTFAQRRLSVAIAHTSDVHDLGEELVRLCHAVIVGPYTFEDSPRKLSTAAAWSSAGVPVIFTAQMPEHAADALRITAALAVRYGMDPAKARRAITGLPAIVTGVPKRIGSIKEGMDADLVVFSDDPLQLDARVLEVYIDGVRVYRAVGSVTMSSRDKSGGL